MPASSPFATEKWARPESPMLADEEMTVAHLPANEPEPTEAATLPVAGVEALVADPDRSENEGSSVRTRVSSYGSARSVESPVTPHPLTGAPNLLARHGEPRRSPFLESLRSLIERSDEESVHGRTAVDPDLSRSGRTDAAPGYDFRTIRDLRNTR